MNDNHIIEGVKWYLEAIYLLTDPSNKAALEKIEQCQQFIQTKLNEKT